MSDLIDRGQAIDALWSLDAELRPSEIAAILNVLNGLPFVTQESKIQQNKMQAAQGYCGRFCQGV